MFSKNENPRATTAPLAIIDQKLTVFLVEITQTLEIYFTH